VPNEDGARKKRRRRLDLMTSLRDEIAVRRTIAGEVISLANLLGRPVVDPFDRRVGRVSDVTVHWDAGAPHPLVSGVLVSLSKGFALVDVSEVTIEQSGVRLRSTQTLVTLPVRHEGDIAWARDVLDRQLLDLQGVQVVRAADVYLCRLSDGWELAGVDVGFRAYARRLLRKRQRCPPPRRAIDWADLQTFVPGAANAGGPIPLVRHRQRAPSGVVFSLDLRPRICASFTPKRSPPSSRTSAGGSRPRLPPWQPHPPPPRRSENSARNIATLFWRS
jgi:sporulation protein YlmC with PRC-barrel domain